MQKLGCKLSSNQIALVVGAAGQDGAYLCRDLLNLGFEVHGVAKKNTIENNWRLVTLGVSAHPKFHQLELDITEPVQVLNLIQRLQPTQVFNFASHSYVADSFNNPHEAAMVTGVAPLNILQAIASSSRDTRFFQAGSSEMFGNTEHSPQNEKSNFMPRNIYASAKLFAHSVVKNFREFHGVFACEAILYNHESPLRGQQFVTRKISQAVAKIHLGQESRLEIGNLAAIRDWGYAPEYVSAMTQIINADSPDTFVVATGRGTTVRDFVQLAFRAIGIELQFQGSGTAEKGFDKTSGQEIVFVNPEFFREAERVDLVGDATKIRDALGWQAATGAPEIVNEMVEADIEILNRQK